MKSILWLPIGLLLVAGCVESSELDVNEPVTAGAPTAAANTSKARTNVQPIHILSAAHENTAFRRVIFTGAKSQVALMAIPPNGDIGFETHGNVEQLLFIESGQGKAILGGTESSVSAGDLIVVKPGTRHDVVNTGTEPLHIYTIYTPPNHIDGVVHATKADAEADKADEAFGEKVH